MNKHQSSILGTALLFLLASCSKMDVQKQEELPEATVEAPVSTGAWKALSLNSSKQEGFTVHTAQISDLGLSASVAEEGLVLVFRKNGNATITLPSEDAAGNFWYYQVSENSIQINCDAYGANQEVERNQNFNYFILSSEKIKSLEEKGTSKADLLQLTYEQAAALLAS
jgi:hypothetical protein